MSTTVTHAFVSEIEDSVDDTLVRPTDWNAEHVIDGSIPTSFVGARAYHNTTQGSLGSGAVNSLSLNSEDWDTDGFHSTVTNNSRFTIPAGLGGKYLLIGHTGMDLAFQPYWKKNGTTPYSAASFTASANESGEVVNVEDLVAGDYVEFSEFHASGTGTAGHASARHVQTEATIVKLESGALGSPPGVKVYNSTTQTMNGSGTNSGNTLVTFNSEEFDTDGYHDTGANTSRITIPTGMSGKYFVGFALWGTTGAPAAATLADIWKNGAAATVNHGVRSLNQVASVQTAWRSETVMDLVAGDYVEVNMNNPNASTFTIGHASAASVQSAFWALRLGGSPSEANTMPWHVSIPVESTPDATINTWSFVRHTDEASGAYANGGTGITNGLTTPVQNDEVAWDVVMAAGTWNLTLHHRASSNVGIYTVTLDGVSLGTIDGYNVTAGTPGHSTISSFVVSSTGKYRLKFKMATKNASSSGYVGNPQAISLRRTA